MKPSPPNATKFRAHEPVRVLLINPRLPESFWSFRWALDKVLAGKRTLNPPLGLATLAALCPPEWQVEIVDENVEALPTEPRADIVGVCGMGVQSKRQRELLAYFRRRGAFVVAGGSYASLCPERYREVADTVIAGEAEYIWREFCADYLRGEPEPEYRERGVVDLADSPTPRFDLLKLDRYATASLQFSRGCPYRCEFCDIIVMFGRRPRTKSTEQIGRELDRLRSLGVKRVFFVDDNLIGHKKKAKALLRYLADYQQRYAYSFQFGTEASINLAEDEELLSLLARANFGWVFIGIESPDEASLKEAGKTQNTRNDILSAVRKIYAAGIDVLAGFIVGFDNDDMGTYERQFQFITESGIQVSMVGLLTALPRTPLYQRLEREQRLLPQPDDGDNTRAGTNFTPRKMSYDDMVIGYRKLWQRLSSDSSIARRIRAKTRFLRRPIYESGDGMGDCLAKFARFVRHGILPGGPGRWLRFLVTLASSPPRAWPLVVNDWVCGLALRDYVARHLRAFRPREVGMAESALAFVRNQCAAALHHRTLEISLRPGQVGAQIVVTLRGAVSKEFFTRATRRLEKLLKHSAATLTLHIESVASEEHNDLARALHRLGRFGDRVTVHTNAVLTSLLPVDWSRFQLNLDEV